MGSGLLQKANLLNKEKGLAFSNFIHKYYNLKFAVFTKQTNFYFITNSLGFDGLSILSSYSTADFWDGLIPGKNTVVNFSGSDGSLNKMLQFFSFSMKDKVNEVSVYKTDDKIILLCNEKISNNFIHDISLLDETITSFDQTRINAEITTGCNVYKYALSYIDAVTSLVNEKANTSEYTDLFKNALLKEISNRLTNYFYSPNCTITTSNNVNNIVLFSKENINDDLLLHHLKLCLQDVVENYSNLISLEFLGQAQTFNEIQDFLKVE